MKIIAKFKSNLIQRLLDIFGAASFLMIFQACYGTPQNYTEFSGKITDNESGTGIEGIQIKVKSDSQEMTLLSDSNGDFTTLIKTTGGTLDFKIIDVDGKLNGLYEDKDTTIVITGENNLVFKINKIS